MRNTEELTIEENEQTEGSEARCARAQTVSAEPDIEAPDFSSDGEGKVEREGTVQEAIEKIDESSPIASKRRSVYLWWIIAASVALIAVVAFFLLRRHQTINSTATSTTSAESASAATVLSPDQQSSIAIEVVQRQTVGADVTAPGKIVFNGNGVTLVFSQFSGRLVRLDAEVGMTVRRGQVLGMIDTPDIIASQVDYQQALTNERTMRTALDLAVRTRERAERLAAAEAIPQRELQQAVADEARAKDDLQRAQSAVEAARGKLQSSGMSEAEINRLAFGAHAVNRLVPLVAPINGTITERKAGLGQVVQPGAGDPLLIIADLSSIWVNADLYEDQLVYAKVGAPVKIQTPAYPNETFPARVDQIGATVDPDKHTVAVRCVVPNPSGRLKPGMFATVILSSAAHQDALTVPASAIITEGDQHAVFVEESPGHYNKRPVEIGSEIGSVVIIRSGLNEGERVVVRGSLLISAQQEGG